MGFWLNVAFLVTGGIAAALLQSGLTLRGVDFPFLLATWQPLAPADWAVILFLAVLMTGVSIGVAHAYKSPQPAIIATLEYAYMIFAIFWGFVFFSEVPDLWTILGMALIAAGGAAVLLVPTRPSQARAVAT